MRRIWRKQRIEWNKCCPERHRNIPIGFYRFSLGIIEPFGFHEFRCFGFNIFHYNVFHVDETISGKQREKPRRCNQVVGAGD